MFRPLLASLALLIIASPALAETPSVILRFKDLDGLIGDIRHLYKMAGREEEGKEFEKRMQAGTGPKGIEGMDTKKPFGLVADLHPRLPESRVWLLLPIADEAAFLKFLGTVDMKPEKQADGTFTVTLPGLPIYNTAAFRFAHGHLYGMLKLSDKAALPAAEKLPKAEGLLGKSDAVVSLAIHVQKVPEAIRKLAVSFLGLQFGAMKDAKPDGETAARKAMREAILDEATARLKSLFEETQTLHFEMGLGKGREEMSLSATLTAKEGSALAKEISALGGKGLSLGGKGALMSAGGNVALPARLRKAVGGLVDETISDGLDLLQEHERELAEPLARAIAPTLKMGLFDGGLWLIAPEKDGKHAFVGGARITDGAKVEKAVKAVLDKLPKDSRKGVTMDVEKAGAVNIHSVTPKSLDDEAKKLFGEGPLYFALKGDAILFAGGEGALGLLKEAITAKPADTSVLSIEGDLERMAGLLAASPDMKNAPKAAKEAFKDGGGKVRLTITGGERLQARLGVQTAVLTFVSLLEKLDKGKK